VTARALKLAIFAALCAALACLVLRACDSGEPAERRKLKCDYAMRQEGAYCDE
jgi:hypothetical protein